MKIKRRFHAFLSDITRPTTNNTSEKDTNSGNPVPSPPPLPPSRPSDSPSSTDESNHSSTRSVSSQPISTILENRARGFATVINIDSSSNTSSEMDLNICKGRQSHTKHMHITESSPQDTPSVSSNRDSVVPNLPHVTEAMERCAERNASRGQSSSGPFSNKEDYNAFFRYRERVPSAEPTIYGDRHRMPSATWSHGHKLRMHSPLESIFTDSEDIGIEIHDVPRVKKNRGSTPGASRKCATVNEKTRLSVPRQDYVPWKSLEGLADIAGLSAINQYPQQTKPSSNHRNTAMHHRSLPKLSGVESGFDPPASAAPQCAPPLRHALSWSNLVEHPSKDDLEPYLIDKSTQTDHACDYAYQPQMVPAYINRQAAAWRHAHDSPWRQTYMFPSQKDLLGLAYGCDMYRSAVEFPSAAYTMNRGSMSQTYAAPQDTPFAPPPYWSAANLQQVQEAEQCAIINMVRPGPAPPPETNCSSEYQEKKEGSRGCMIGWMLGCTAIIILALAIALFVQVTKDAQQISRLRTAVSKEWQQYEESFENKI